MSDEPRGVVRELLSAMSARLLVLPVGAVAAIFTTRLVNEALGAQSFAVYSLVAGLPLLFSYADLGLGAAITNAASTAKTDPVRFRAILRRSLLISLSIAAVIATASTLLGAAGLWTSLLGLSDPNLNAPISFAMVLFGFSIPGGLGKSILLGIGRYGPSVIIQGLIPVVSLVVVAVAIRFGAQTGGVVAVSSLGIFFVNWIGFIFAAVVMPGTLADYRGKPQRGVMGEVIRTSMPMLALAAGGGVLFQSGRLVLSHTSTLQQVAVYAALWTFFQPLFSVIQAAGLALWPRFAAGRAAGRAQRREFRAATLTSATIGLCAGLGLTAFGPLAVRFASAGQIEADTLQCVVLGTALLVQATMLPAGMVLTFPRGLWFQSITTWVAAGIVVSVGALASASLGATAPMLGLLAGITIGQALPTIAVAAIFLKGAESAHV
jgi:O-antigen/teichoic acid export membrane protein